MRNKIQTTISDFDDVEKDKFVNCVVSYRMIIPSIAELPKLSKSDLNY